ncbi:tyrosine-type recombinase/integrase [Falseniella ignava]|nr:tyrosine-type recombinase/integrase [Falseniella ignava]
MASVKKRGKTWEYTVSYKKGKGDYGRLTKGGFRTKKEAESEARQLEVSISEGYNPIKKEMLFSEYFKDWYELYKKQVITDVTIRKYKATYNNIKKYIPHHRLCDLDRKEYQKLLNEFGKTHSLNTSKTFHSHLKACITDALEDKVILINPTYRAVVTGKIPSKPQEEKYLEYDDFKRLVNETWSRLSKYHSHYLILIMCYTGCRLAEAQGLTWNNINYEEKTLRIEKTWSYNEKERATFIPTKNREIRTITMPNQLIELFQIYHKFQEENDLLIDRVIPDTISANGVNKMLKNIQSHLEINPQITSHGLRHTHASVLLSDGLNILTVAERLGHKDITVTQKVYSHLLTKLKEKDIEKIQSALNF